MNKAFLTSLAASLHIAGLQDEQQSLVSHSALGARDSQWVGGVTKLAADLDSYWGTGAALRIGPREDAFTAPPRFEDLKPIGHGGMGVVYSAFDKHANERVAIKVGRSLHGDSDFIKREFRTLAKIRHPNLVVLKELHQFDGNVFFSMEYIQGDRFNSKSVLQKEEGVAWQSDQLADVCDKLLQLASGVEFLHSNGYVHCDIKPSNILVTARGRVVVMDLGLARSSRVHRRGSLIFGGTSEYMSPEQAAGEPLQPASDWYAFGIVMFEVLFGRRPFLGNDVDVLVDKLSGNVLVPPEEETGVAESLSNLCLRLLNPAPPRRPGFEGIRRCLEGFLSQRCPPSSVAAPATDFFGREEELATLDRALVDSGNASEPTLLFVQGDSGIGKTHLIQQFLENACDAGETIVFSGRCYENERIPYKAIDAIVGEMAIQWYLQDPPDSADADSADADSAGADSANSNSSAAESVSPALVNAVGAVFKSFSSFADQPDTSAVPSPQMVADGLQAILRSQASQGKRVVIFIDDIQWADADSGELLSKMIRGIPLLLVCSHRPMAQPNPFLVHLTGDSRSKKSADAEICSPTTIQRIKVAPFSAGDAEQFLDHSFPGLSKPMLDKAVGASEGVPMFLTSLAQQICTMPAGQIESDVLDWTRDLTPEAKRLLEFVCASGYPLPRAIALEAAKISQDGEASISALCAKRLIALSQSAGELVLAPFHDMIRESTYSDLDGAEKIAVHSALATVSEKRADVPPARLAFHFGEAGDRDKCCHYSILSGDVAVKSQAFAEAVRAYEEALVHFAGSDADKQDLKQKLAASLGRLGRSSEAGDAYFELASDAKSKGATYFLQLAAYQYCCAGRIEDALAGFDRLLQRWGYSTFQSETAVIWRLVGMRVKLSFHDMIGRLKDFGKSIGLRGSAKTDPPVKRDALIPTQGDFSALESTSDARTLCDLLWDIGIALSFFDMVQACLFTQYSLLVAIRSGDEARILRGNIWRANNEALFGTPRQKFVQKLLEASDTPTTRAIPYLTGLHLLVTGMSAHYFGDFEKSIEKCAQADQFLTTHAKESVHLESGSAYYLDQMCLGAANLFEVFALQYAGRYKEMIKRYHDLIAAPNNREHLLNTSNLMIFVGPYVHLAADNPNEARASIDKALKMWPVDKLCFQQIIATYIKTEVNLYAQDYRAAEASMEELWRTATESNYFHFEGMRIPIWQLRGRLAVTRMGTPDGKAAAKIAWQAIKKLEREKVAWARPMADKLRASVALAKQDFEVAEQALLAARDGFARCKKRLYQHTAEAKLCEIRGALETERYRDVRDWFEFQGIKNRQAFIQLHYPLPTEHAAASSVVEPEVERD